MKDSPIYGILSVLGLALVIILVAQCHTSCAEYPLTLSVKGDSGKVSISRKSGIEVTIEK